MTILITGGAGFIGSNLIASLNDSGIDDIVIVDDFSSGSWKNLVKRRFLLMGDTDDVSFVKNLDGATISAVVHLAADTDTLQDNACAALSTNYFYSEQLLDWCQEHDTPFIYASSAAVYGDGSQGFFTSAAECYQPLNLYGWSKLLFDRMVEQFAFHGAFTAQVVGLRFFNVYGPNEHHKGRMASLVAQKYSDVKAGTAVTFAPDWQHGVPRRDFVYVDDVVAVVRWFVDHPDVSGIFNVGTGTARTFEDFLLAANPEAKLFKTPMPPGLRDTYQFFTQADLTALRKAGCNVPFRPIEQGVKHYVENYLSQKDKYR